MTRRPDLLLDPRTASLGREWFEQVRRKEREEAAAEAASDEARRHARRDGETDDDPWNWLFGDDGDGDGDTGD